MTRFDISVESFDRSRVLFRLTVLTVFSVLVSNLAGLLWSAESSDKACTVLADKRVEEPLRTIAKEYAFRTGSEVSLRFLPVAEVEALVQKKKTESDVVLDIGKEKGSKSPVGELPGAKRVAWKHPTGEPVWAARLTDDPHHDLLGVDDPGDAELFEIDPRAPTGILPAPDAGDAPHHIALGGQSADQDVDLVDRRYGQDHLGVVDAGLFQRRLQLAQLRHFAIHGRQFVFADQRLLQAPLVGYRRVHIGFRQRHREQMQRRLHLDIVGGDRLGDMLLVLLAFLGHVDHEIAEDARVAAEATAILEALLRLVVALGLGETGEVIGA